MKKVTIAVASLFAAASFAAVAAPVEMSKKEMSKVVAGAAPESRGAGLTTASDAGALASTSVTPAANAPESMPAGAARVPSRGYGKFGTPE